MERDPTVRALSEALAHSPDNPPLRRHLARVLLDAGRRTEAIEQLRHALRLSDDDATRLDLARAYLEEERPGHAAVVLELMAARPDPPAEALLLLARVHQAEGRGDEAARAYRRAVDLDPALAQPRLATPQPHRSGTPGEEKGPEPRREPAAGRGRDDDQVDAGTFERPHIAFADVGGMDAVKDEIAMKAIRPLQHPELFQVYGKRVGGGILLYGPPGCGKTHLARATAGEIGAGFLSVGIHEVLDMWIGESEKRLHALFDSARSRAPCVLFFDEVDALAAKRADMHGASGRHVINQFLAELDGPKHSNDGVLVLAATNAPWQMDPAFRRPGRFDRVILVPPPDESARAAILAVMLAGKPVQRGLDLRKVAARTDGFSGADLKGLVDLVVEDKLRDALRTGAPAPIGDKDLLAAAKRQRPTTKEWFATAKNHVLFANEGGIYDELARYMGL